MPISPAKNSLERALRLLDVVAREPGGLTNAEISRRMRMATSTSSYILRRLERGGYLHRDRETARYGIGLKVVELSHRALRDTGFRELAEPALHRLAESTRQAAYIAVLERGRAMLVDKVSSPEFLKVDIDIGSPLPAHATALGKALLAHLSSDALNQWFEENALTRETSITIISKPKLLQELETIRARGYAVVNGEQSLGVRAIAAPIIDPSGVVRASVSATGSSSQQVWRYPEDVIRRVKAAAIEISRRGRFAP
jgi:IclR family transcriptional regulator, KDG regulon repressor